MAQYAYTFVSGDTVTPTKLNNARTISNIVNADVSATAAIAGSKIAPTFTTQVTVPNGTESAPSIRVTGEQTGLFRASSVQLGVSVDGVNALRVGKPVSGTSGAFIQLPTPAATDYALIALSGSDSFVSISGSTGLSAGGQIRVYGSTHATKPNFVELTNGNTVRMTVTNSGNVGINTTSPAHLLDVSGDSNTSGVFRVGGTQVVTSRRTGWTAPTGTATRTTFATSTVTTAQLAERVKALIDDLTTHGLIGS
jgi:hypothetical protein